MSRRTQRVDELLHRAVQQVLSRGLNDPRTEGLLTVTGVKVDEHLGSAVVSVSMLPEKKLAMAVKALEHASRHIRREAAEIAGMHRMPTLTFRADTAPARQREVLEAIAKGRAELEAREAALSSGAAPADGAGSPNTAADTPDTHQHQPSTATPAQPPGAGNPTETTA